MPLPPIIYKFDRWEDVAETCDVLKTMRYPLASLAVHMLRECFQRTYPLATPADFADLLNGAKRELLG